MNKPVKQHYLPVSYLKGFSDPNILRRLNKHNIYVYEKGRSVRVSTPKAEAYEKHLYTLSTSNGDEFKVEKYLAGVEDEATPIIAKAQSKEYEFSPAEKKLLAQYIALMFTRTPALREYERKFSGPASLIVLKKLASDDPEGFAKEWDAYVKGDKDAPNADYARKRILEGVLDKEDPDTPLESMLYVARMIAEIIEQFGWQVLHACRHETFVTSDFPIVGVERYSSTQMRLGVGFNTPNSEFYFPLSAKTCLRMAADIDMSIGHLTSRNVRLVNDMEMRYAHRRIYAATNSERIRTDFEKQFGAMRLGENALVPTWDGKPVF